jgi:hypothetical protein
LRRTTPRPAKSLTFRVTRVRPCSSAVAAIIPSGALKGRPANSRIPPGRPHRAAMAYVTGRTRPGNRRLKSVARTCVLGPRLFIRNWAAHLQIGVRPSTLGSVRSLTSQIGHAKTAAADITPGSSTTPLAVRFKSFRITSNAGGLAQTLVPWGLRFPEGTWGSCKRQ